jgi:hypothetical protein
MRDHRHHITTNSTAPRAARGATCIDVLVGLGCATLLAGAALPLLGAMGSASGEARSLSNLRTLAAANEAYGATFDGRQYTAIPEDAGLVNGSCEQYLLTIACPPPHVLGDAPNGFEYGYYLSPMGFCAPFGYPGTCANWVVYKPLTLSGVNAGFGSFRLPNARAFNTFVDGRFYSDTFYSPNDTATATKCAPHRDAGVDFDLNPSGVAFSSYCFSPAAMHNPMTLSASGYVNPDSYADAYVSPPVSACVHPDLKTRMIEHNWNYRAPAQGNINFAGGIEPWYFNASASASSQSIFFDGHVGRVRTATAVEDDAAAQASSGVGLWHRGTPLGAAGYFGNQSFDGTLNSHSILTIDGILGRDVLTPQ